VTRVRVAADDMKSVPLGDELLASQDCVVVTTDHSSYDFKHIAARSNLVFDTRGATRGLQGDNIVRLGE